MRKQYNLRKSSEGLKAWDVDRLISLSKSFLIKRIPLDAIKEVNEPYWFEHDNQLPTCLDVLNHMKLIEAADLHYPIILCANGGLMDGMHRVLKALLQGDVDIEAVQFEVTPEADFIGVVVNDFALLSFSILIFGKWWLVFWTVAVKYPFKLLSTVF